MGLRGKLLVAEPTLGDPNFHRTVVLVLEHGDGGALGVVLNRPSEMAAHELVTEWAPFVSEPDVVFVGGPVAPDAAVCLGLRPDADVERQGWQPLFGAIGAVDLNGDPADMPSGLEGLRIFAGYAGWSPGQLEGEMEVGGWYVVERDDGDPFSTDPGSLWSSVLQRQPGSLRSVAFFPADPADN